MMSSIFTINGNLEQRSSSEENIHKRISGIRWKSKVQALLVGAAAFTANCIIAGFMAALAIYQVEFKRTFSASNGLITITVFLPAGIFGTVGLLTGVFLDKFGVRITAIAGSILLTISVGICAYATDVIFLLVVLGIFAGTGSSFVYISMTMGVYSYFEHKGRSLIPLVTLGEACGTVIFPPLTSYLIENYLWRGSFLMMSGLILQLTICSMIFSMKNSRQQKSKIDHKKRMKSKPSDAPSTSNLPTQNKSVRSNLTPTVQSENPSPAEEHNVSSLIMTNLKNSNKNEKNSKNSVDGPVCKECRELQAKDVISEKRPREYSLLDSVTNSEPKPNTELDSNSKLHNRKAQQRKILVSIMKNKHFLLFIISTFIIIGSTYTMLTDLPDFYVNQGMTLSESANAYAIGASGDALARIVGGWLLFRNKVSSLIIFTVSGISMGLLIVIYPLLNSFYLITVLSFFVLFFCGLLLSVYSVVVMDFFDINHYAIAMGISETMAGTGIVVVGYIIGLITEYNDGSYVTSFYILSALSVTCMLPILIPYLYRRRTVSIRIS